MGNLKVAFLVLIAINLSLIAGYIINDIDNKLYSKEVLYETCDGLDLSNTANCLHSEVLENYNYTLTDDSKFLSDDELFSLGGDCKDWSEYYLRRIDDLDGYYGKEAIFKIGGKNAHQITIISNDEGYCILDQIVKPVCYNLRDYNE